MKGKCLLITGDINAKHCAWNSPVDDIKGKLFFDFVVPSNLIILNNGNKPTFTRQHSKSFIDMSICDHSTIISTSMLVSIVHNFHVFWDVQVFQFSRLAVTYRCFIV